MAVGTGRGDVPAGGGDHRTGDRHRPAPPARAKPNPNPPGVLLDAGVVTRLHEDLYGNLPHGRLVLLGGPGAGKAGAMILLLLAALDHRHRMPEAQRGEVPVWLTLGGWDPTTQTLHQWAAATIYRDHPYLRAPDYGPDAAGELLRAGRVALFLDGLDEMAPAAQGKALARVEQEGAGLRIALSSRPDEYRQAISEDRMHNTAVIEIQPVDPEAARAYLLHDQIGSQHDGWAQLGDYLTDHPDSIAAHALNNPLTLSLARATYQNQDPTSLTDLAEFSTVAALREYLIDRILITAYPDERQRAHATRWLAWIAHHMGSERDLVWWHIPTWISRWQLRLAVGLVGGLVGLFTIAVGKEPQVLFPRWPPPGDLFGTLALGLVVGFAVWREEEPAIGLAFGLLGLLFLWTVPLPRAATATPAARYRIGRRDKHWDRPRERARVRACGRACVRTRVPAHGRAHERLDAHGQFHRTRSRHHRSWQSEVHTGARGRPPPSGAAPNGGCLPVPPRRTPRPPCRDHRRHTQPPAST